MKRTLVLGAVAAGILVSSVQNLPVTGRLTTTWLISGRLQERKVERFYRSVDGSTLTIRYERDDESGRPKTARLWDAKARKLYTIDYLTQTYQYSPRVSPADGTMEHSKLAIPGERFTDSVDGVPCSLYPRVPFVLAARSTCYSDKFGLPIRSKHTDQDSVTIFEYSDLKVDEVRDGSFFAIPEGFAEAPPKKMMHGVLLK